MGGLSNACPFFLGQKNILSFYNFTTLQSYTAITLSPFSLSHKRYDPEADNKDEAED